MTVTIIVEDGSVVSNANSYIDDVAADAILALEPLDLTSWLALTSDNKKRFLIAATRWLDDRVIWKGHRKTDPDYPNQPTTVTPQKLGWPRKSAYDREGRAISETVVPDEVRRATVLMANYLLTSNGEAEDQAGIRRFRADTFEIEYQQGWYKSPCPPWLKFVLFGLGQPANELGFKKIARV